MTKECRRAYLSSPIDDHELEVRVSGRICGDGDREMEQGGDGSRCLRRAVASTLDLDRIGAAADRESS